MPSYWQNTARKSTVVNPANNPRISTLDFATLGELIYDSEEDESPPPSPTSQSATQATSAHSWIVGKRHNELLLPSSTPSSTPISSVPFISPPLSSTLQPLSLPLKGPTPLSVGPNLGARRSRTPPPFRPKLAAMITWQEGSPSLRNARIDRIDPSLAPKNYQLQFSTSPILPLSAGRLLAPSVSAPSSATTDSLSWVPPRKQNKEGRNVTVQQTSRKELFPRVFQFETRKINKAGKTAQKVLEVSLDKHSISSYHAKKQTTNERQGSELLQVCILSLFSSLLSPSDSVLLRSGNHELTIGNWSWYGRVENISLKSSSSFHQKNVKGSWKRHGLSE